MEPTISEIQPQPVILPPPPPPKLLLFLPILLTFLLTSTILIGGFFAYQYFNQSKPIAVIPSPSPSPTTIPLPTNTLKKYTNNTHHITFSYPETWSISNSNDQEEYNADIILEYQSAEIHLIFNVDGIGGQTQNYQGTPFDLDGHHVYQYSILDYTGKNVVIGVTDSLTNSLGVLLIDKTTYLMTLTYPKTDPLANEYESDFDQILSTFKFTDSTTTPTDWKTYQNQDLNFVFKYPSTFSLEENDPRPNDKGYWQIQLISPLTQHSAKDTLVNSKELKVEIFIQPQKPDDSLNKFFDEQARTDGNPLGDHDRTTINGIPAIKLNWEGMGTGTSYYLLNGNKRIIITKYPQSTNLDSTFDQILSSFKFTN